MKRYLFDDSALQSAEASSYQFAQQTLRNETVARETAQDEANRTGYPVQVFELVPMGTMYPVEPAEELA